MTTKNDKVENYDIDSMKSAISDLLIESKLKSKSILSEANLKAKEIIDNAKEEAKKEQYVHQQKINEMDKKINIKIQKTKELNDKSISEAHYEAEMIKNKAIKEGNKIINEAQMYSDQLDRTTRESLNEFVDNTRSLFLKTSSAYNSLMRLIEEQKKQIVGDLTGLVSIVEDLDANNLIEYNSKSESLFDHLSDNINKEPVKLKHDDKPKFNKNQRFSLKKSPNKQLKDESESNE